MKSFLHPAAPYTMQAASNIVVPAVELMYSVANPSIYQITTDGAVAVKSIYNGQPKSVEYPNGLSAATLAIEADANTKVLIIGKTTEIKFVEFSSTGTEPVSAIFIKQDEVESISNYYSFGPSKTTGILSRIDITSCVNLSYLRLDACPELTSLDLSANTALTTLYCNSCSGLTSLDLSANTALTTLYCNSCSGLTSLDLSANTALTFLSCNSCSGLTSLDLSANTALTFLSCDSCSGLTSLDLSANTALTTLRCDSCSGLTSLDLSANTALTTLYCDSCSGLTSLDLSANTALIFLFCDSCSGLTSLDLSANTALTTLSCDSCSGLTSIKYRAIKNGPSSKIASAITSATSTAGTVYLNSSDPYYQTVATAATNKGWTIAAL